MGSCTSLRTLAPLTYLTTLTVMSDHHADLELERGTGNIFADLGVEDSSLRQLRALLAAEIIKTLDAERPTVRDAEARTGIAAADFSRIRQVRLDRFTIDRLMRILDRLNRDVRVKISVSKRPQSASRPASIAA